MRIGIYFGGTPLNGGGYSIQQTILELVAKYNNRQFDFVVFCRDIASQNVAKSLKIKSIIIPNTILWKMRRYLSRQKWIYSIKGMEKFFQSPLEKLMIRSNIDLVYLPSPSSVALELQLLNYIITLWDLAHFEQLEFPEIRVNGELERRQWFYDRVLNKAVTVIVDSEYGKLQVIKHYSVQPERISPLPFMPNNMFKKFIPNSVVSESILKKYHIHQPYIFYPAQFWSHKNHIYILEALRLLKNSNGWMPQAVFSGSDKGNLQYVLETAERLDVRDCVNYIGFVDVEEIMYLYSLAMALVMPTYLGPTNLPPLEAFAVGTPVCYSDLLCFREQVGDAAWFMDLNDPSSLSEILLDIRDSSALKEQKKQLGKQLLESWTEDHYWEELKKVFKRYEYKMRCWNTLKPE